MSGDTIERVKQCLGEVLALNPSDIGERASLINDLGADSLDLVELMFVLERQFGVRLTQDDLRLTRQLGLHEDEIHVEEVVTPLALERLRQLFPDATQLLVEGVTRRQLAVLLTVQQIAAAIDEKLAQPAVP
jgi:acyl carrier protein